MLSGRIFQPQQLNTTGLILSPLRYRLKRGCSLREIARELGKSPSSISREQKKGEYDGRKWKNYLKGEREWR
ncbi:hypothetical protein COT20_00915 [bacterium (Candidatus Gribaldobacteria) CG08_land_8_20_14_0_20_39_15]|uniref:Transposase IS30-like HTH domain-containing protein n=1 Tax=bacterium (Candidatus Gribaldobacteria) CG08_land_8_20_14_0_20_39_15 TaxID=2014273 RepID=A0A2M6XUX0_9BACT|nr:MAG: hypothetical protein COT20_00915 [bacterium (Candidatus Gribaldobacteria) CG08_land_8_20_14_0_20_39_15]